MRRRVAAIMVALVAASLLFVVDPAAPARGQAEAGGGGGTGSSAVTVTVDEGEFKGLRVTVSQTRDLANQAVVITWTGATPTPRNRLLASDYFQIMQCYGDPDAPGDPKGLKFRETCQFGVEFTPPAIPNSTGVNSSTSLEASSRARYQSLVAGYPADDTDETLPKEAQVVPFQPIGGRATPNGSPSQPFPVIKSPVPPYTERTSTDVEVLAQYFTTTTTNEVPFALSDGSGNGRAVFEVQNAALAPHLGCGAGYTDLENKQHPAPECSIVIVPRGHQQPFDGQPATAVHGSPFVPALWKNRIVVPLEFNPVASPCSLTKSERATAGTELIAEAITSWQPVLCAGDGPVFGYSGISDFEVGPRVLSPGTGGPGVGFTAEGVQSSSPALIHAPVTVSAPVIAVNVDANLRDLVEGDLPPDVNALAGLAISDIKLTPRLVAKMLTFSYTLDVASQTPPNELAKNYQSIRFDPEFVDLNPTFAYWTARKAATLNGLMVSVGSSLAARDMWRWIEADPAAKKWLTGTPDETGMVVNPAYKGVSFSTLDTYPKLDTRCFTGPAPDYDHVQNCTFGYRPYMGSLTEAALQTLRADVKAAGSTMTTGSANPNFDPNNPRFDAIPRQQPGARLAMSITDSASAARYGLFTAQLCKAVRGGDGKFTTTDCRRADTQGMTAAVATAAESNVPGVRIVDPAKAWATPDAYPLTTITYAVADTSDPKDARKDYAKLLRYAAGAGQTPGPADGQLPEGYVPLTQAMREQTMIAADKLENWVEPTTPAPSDETTTSPEPTAPASVPASGLPPSAAITTPATQPPAAPVAQTTLGSPLGMIRFLLIVALVVGLVGGVAGPVMQRLASRTRKTGLK